MPFQQNNSVCCDGCSEHCVLDTATEKKEQDHNVSYVFYPCIGGLRILQYKSEYGELVSAKCSSISEAWKKAHIIKKLCDNYKKAQKSK